MRQIKSYAKEKLPGCKRFVLAGHSKGATVALLAADPDDIVISISGRFHIYHNAYARYSREEITEMEQKGFIMKNFGKVTIKVTPDSFEERKHLEETIL